LDPSLVIRLAEGSRTGPGSTTQDDDVQVGNFSLPRVVELLDLDVIGAEDACLGPVGAVSEERREAAQGVGAQVEIHLAKFQKAVSGVDDLPLISISRHVNSSSPLRFRV